MQVIDTIGIRVRRKHYLFLDPSVFGLQFCDLLKVVGIWVIICDPLFACSRLHLKVVTLIETIMSSSKIFKFLT